MPQNTFAYPGDVICIYKLFYRYIHLKTIRYERLMKRYIKYNNFHVFNPCMHTCMMRCPGPYDNAYLCIYCR